MNYIVFLIQCPDQKGLVSRISSFFFQRGFNILECQEHVDVLNSRYFMRIKLDMEGLSSSRKELEDSFGTLGLELSLSWSVHYSDQLSRTAIFVTKAPHCLYDLLARREQKEIKCRIPLIISNHPDLEMVAEKFRIPFYCLPVKGADDKQRQENEILKLLRQHHIDLIILARYMRILSPSFIKDCGAEIINIHHAFLPAFKGANPYKKAYEYGVKMIGATAHYATAELDAGPIIEQDVRRVNHKRLPEDLSKIGSDIERLVLARAVEAHLERRIMVYENRTIVFS